MPFRLGPTEAIIILVVVILIFGVGKLPEVGGALGKAIRGFRGGISGEEDPVQANGNSERRRMSSRRKAANDTDS